MTQVDQSTWFLGIDLGTTAIVATLGDAATGALYPLYWRDSQSARLPVLAYLPGGSDSLVVGAAALETIRAATEVGQLPSGLVIQDFKPFLNLALPYRAEQDWEPQIPWNDRQSLPLALAQQAIASLLESLRPTQVELPWGVVGWSPEALRSALGRLSGVGLSCPAHSSDAYHFNLREAVLQASLVVSADRIFFLESAIAVLLTQLPTADLPVPERSRSRPGATLVIDAGASTTELLLVNLPQNLERLDRPDLYLRSLSYGGNALDQDIAAQLLHSSSSPALAELLMELKPLLPLPGEPEEAVRHRLQQQLRSSLLGQQLLAAARHLKLEPQSATLSLQNSIELIGAGDLDRRVIAPYVQRLNRELNTLLSQSGMVAESIVQVVQTGGTAALPAIGRWLRQKLPNARLNSPDRSPMFDRSPVADGLALLPRYPQVLNTLRHQYGEFFLLREVLQAIPPSQSLAIGRILQLLESRGLNTQGCRRAILSLLEKLPAGLLPSQSNGILSASNLTVDRGTPLFSQQGSQYTLNAAECDRLWLHFSTVLAHSHQTLEEPLSCDLSFGRAESPPA